MIDTLIGFGLAAVLLAIHARVTERRVARLYAYALAEAKAEAARPKLPREGDMFETRTGIARIMRVTEDTVTWRRPLGPDLEDIVFTPTYRWEAQQQGWKKCGFAA